MTTKLDNLKRYYRSPLPLGEVLVEACRKYEYKTRSLGEMPFKPTVRVFKAQGKSLLVLRVGDQFVSAFTWKRLIQKAAFGPWLQLDRTTLARRWTCP